MLLTSKILIVLAALIAILATQNLNAISLSLFLVVEQACIILGILLYGVVAIIDFFSHHGAQPTTAHRDDHRE